MSIFFKYNFDSIKKIKKELDVEGLDLQYYDTGSLVFVDSHRNCIELECDSIQELSSQMISVLSLSNSIDGVVSDNENYNIRMISDDQENVILFEEWSEKNAKVKLVFNKAKLLEASQFIFKSTSDELLFLIPEIKGTSQFNRLKEFTFKTKPIA